MLVPSCNATCAVGKTKLSIFLCCRIHLTHATNSPRLWSTQRLHLLGCSRATWHQKDRCRFIHVQTSNLLQQRCVWQGLCRPAECMRWDGGVRCGTSETGMLSQSVYMCVYIYTHYNVLIFLTASWQLHHIKKSGAPKAIIWPRASRTVGLCFSHTLPTLKSEVFCSSLSQGLGKRLHMQRKKQLEFISIWTCTNKCLLTWEHCL